MDIYKITNNVNGMIYIGQSKDSYLKRFRKHCLNSKNPRVINTMRLYYEGMAPFGCENFSVELIAQAGTQEELDHLEWYFIEYYNSRDKKIGYNDVKGGHANPMYSETIKEKHSKTLKNPEVRKKISESLKQYRQNNPFTEEHRKNLSNAMKGNHNFGSGDTRSIGVYCIDENNVKHEFHSIKDATVWWFANYKPFGDRYVLVTLQRKLKLALENKLELPIKWFKL